MARAVLGETPFAVVDIETTGIYPGRFDRIIEVAVVRLTPKLEVEDEWTTLINPKWDIGRTDSRDPDTQSSKAEKARQYGTRIIAEPAFWRALGIAVD